MKYVEIAVFPSRLEAEAIGHALDPHGIPFLVQSADIGIFGRDPGRHEVVHGEPFVGKGGELVRDGLHRATRGGKISGPHRCVATTDNSSTQRKQSLIPATPPVPVMAPIATSLPQPAGPVSITRPFDLVTLSS